MNAPPPVARLERYERAFGGDNAYYVIEGGKLNGQHIVVAVGWALMCPHETVITFNTKYVAFTDPRYVQPGEALRRLGYVVDGEVNFCDPETFKYGNLVECGNAAKN